MKLTSVILLLIYSVASFVGIGVNHCGCTHSQRIVMLSVQSSCICSRLVETCCPHNEMFHDAKEEDEDSCGSGCCSLEYQYVEIDQMNVKHSQGHSTKALTLFCFPFLLANGISAVSARCFFEMNINSPPDHLFRTPMIYLHRQLRL